MASSSSSSPNYAAKLKAFLEDQVLYEQSIQIIEDKLTEIMNDSVAISEYLEKGLISPEDKEKLEAKENDKQAQHLRGNLEILTKKVKAATSDSIPAVFSEIQSFESSLTELQKKVNQLNSSLKNLKLLALERTAEQMPEDFAQIIKMAEEGDIEKQLLLGKMFREGKGVEKNLQTAFDWYSKAAELGNAQAQYNLGYFFYVEGILESVPKDHGKATEYFQAAAEQKHPSATLQLLMAHEFHWLRQEPSFLSETQLKDIMAWSQESAHQGIAEAECCLGLMYWYQDKWLGKSMNAAEAAHYFYRAAEKGIAHAQYHMGDICQYYSDYLLLDYIKEKNPYKWYSQAAEQGHRQASPILKDFLLEENKKTGGKKMVVTENIVYASLGLANRTEPSSLATTYLTRAAIDHPKIFDAIIEKIYQEQGVEKIEKILNERLSARAEFIVRKRWAQNEKQQSLSLSTTDKNDYPLPLSKLISQYTSITCTQTPISKKTLWELCVEVFNNHFNFSNTAEEKKLHDEVENAVINPNSLMEHLYHIHAAASLIPSRSGLSTFFHPLSSIEKMNQVINKTEVELRTKYPEAFVLWEEIKNKIKEEMSMKKKF